MICLLLQFVFLVLPVILPMALYRSRRPFMAVFCRAMTGNALARKFYTQVLVALLLLFHYVYTTGHPGQFGTVLSAIVCAAMFSARHLSPAASSHWLYVSCRSCSPCPLPSHISFWQPCSIPPAEFWSTGRTGTGDFTCRNIRMRCPTSTIAIITRGCHDNADRSGLILSAQ